MSPSSVATVVCTSFGRTPSVCQSLGERASATSTCNRHLVDAKENRQLGLFRKRTNSEYSDDNFVYALAPMSRTNNKPRYGPRTLRLHHQSLQKMDRDGRSVLNSLSQKHPQRLLSYLFGLPTLSCHTWRAASLSYCWDPEGLSVTCRASRISTHTGKE